MLSSNTNKVSIFFLADGSLAESLSTADYSEVVDRGDFRLPHKKEKRSKFSFFLLKKEIFQKKQMMIVRQESATSSLDLSVKLKNHQLTVGAFHNFFFFKQIWKRTTFLFFLRKIKRRMLITNRLFV